MTPMDPDELLRTAINALAGGVDVEKAHETIDDILSGLREAAKSFKAMNFQTDEVAVMCPQPGCKCKFMVTIPIKPETLAKAMSHAAKVIDETARLTQFVEGKADSRPDVGGVGTLASVLSGLKAEQLQTVLGWLAENEVAAKAT